ncbi:uncharacterized protein LOC126704240 [Quercus robur]|uniref:uncharacterized protein LOC126704240 n=1 Tax=Quercus robur TaxID=38942 RepID=UPI0021627845|nr:uncharacterized protein LOC126704240 [Quercus robur]
MWLADKGCGDTVLRAWQVENHGTPMFKVVQKLKKCKKMLKSWSKEHFSNVKNQIKMKKEELWKAEELAANEVSYDLVVSLKRELNFLLEKESQMWRQRARTQCVAKGDNNTKYFHVVATQRKRRNFIKGIWEADEGVKRVVTDSMNTELTKPYSREEVDVAIKQMAPSKAPVSNPENVSDFRPINLCNVLYKIISKVIANRLKPLLNSIISEAQSAFTTDRLITDNILIAFESLHYMKTQCSGKEGFMALKLDMSKAYDRVEWKFLERILLQMGFQESWVAMIMQCVSTVTYSILLNGEPQGFIQPSRGLRQGDPLSPFLFLFCAEGLNALLCKAAEDNEIRDASRQQVNSAKTTLFFSRNTPENVQQEIKVLLGVPAIKNYEKYLGLPSFVGRQKKACFNQIKERIWNKMQGRKERLFSQAGKEVMIKAVVQSIPTYSMSMFRLPLGLIKDIEAMICKFWWGHQDNARKMQWVKWSTLCSSKSLGGMGFWDLRQFNDALLGKQVWRLFHEKDTLLYKVFKSKYFPNGSILDVDINPQSSFAWKSILQAREVIYKGARWRVGDGSRINIWTSRWVESSGGQILSPQHDPSLVVVKDLFLPGTKIWDVELIDQNFFPWEAKGIKSIPVSLHTEEDLLIWPRTPDGIYSVKSASQLMANEIQQAQTDQTLSFPRSKVFRSFGDLVSFILTDTTSNIAALFSMVAWSIWTRRNKLGAKEQVWDMGDTVRKAKELLQEFRDVQRSSTRPVVPREVVRWKPPSAGLFKINFDGAIFENMDLAGLGVVARTSMG